MSTTFKATIDHVHHTTSRASVRSHTMLVDRGIAKGGFDLGPAGGEYQLVALGGCFTSHLLAAIRSREAAVSNVKVTVSGTLAAFGNGVIRPALTSLITQQAGRQEQGVVLGITQSLMSMASVVAPIVGGLLIERQMLKEWAWAAAGLAAVGVALSREGLPFYATASADSIGTP